MSEKHGFFERVKQIWGPILLLAVCFSAGFWLKAQIDHGKFELMEKEIDAHKRQIAEETNVADLFAKFDLAQMSSGGEYQLLVGNSVFGCMQSPITGMIDSALALIQNGECVRALAEQAQNHRTLSYCSSHLWGTHVLACASGAISPSQRVSHPFTQYRQSDASPNNNHGSRFHPSLYSTTRLILERSAVQPLSNSTS